MKVVTVLRILPLTAVFLLALLATRCTPLAPTGRPPDAGLPDVTVAADGAIVSPVGDGGPSPDCVSPEQACGSVCADPMQSQQHCGRCGRDCQGAECFDGACLPVQVAGGLESPIALAVDATHVFVSENGARLLRVPLAGGTAQPIALGRVQAVSLVADPAGIFFAERGLSPGRGALRRVGKGGGKITDILSGLDLPQALALDGPTLFFITDDVPSGEAGAVFRVASDPAVGGAAMPLAPGQDDPSAIAVDATHVYWANRASETAGGGGVYRVPIGGGEVETVASGLSFPDVVALDQDDVYFASQEPGTSDSVLYQRPKSGGDAVEIFRDRALVAAVLADDQSVYWIAGSPGRKGGIWRWSKGGGEPVLMAGGQSYPAALAQDARTLYWTNLGSVTTPDGTVMKVAK